MARTIRHKLDEYEGRKVWVFPRKRFGQRCSCYDVVTQRRTRSNCKTCYDTGWVGGYDSPLEVSAKIIDPLQTTAQVSIGEVNNENTKAFFPNYPELFRGWIVVEGENIRWRVGNDLQKVSQGRALVEQVVPLHRVQSSDIEYSLPINLSNINTIETSPARNFTNPQTLTSVHTSVGRALELFI